MFYWISWNNLVFQSLFREYVNCHSKLNFLGLALTEYCEYSMFTNDQSPDFIGTMTVSTATVQLQVVSTTTEQIYRQKLNLVFPIQVSGEADERQIMEALRRYVSRCVYVQKSLYTLFRLTQIMLKPREDIIKVD